MGAISKMSRKARMGVLLGAVLLFAGQILYLTRAPGESVGHQPQGEGAGVAASPEATEGPPEEEEVLIRLAPEEEEAGGVTTVEATRVRLTKEIHTVGKIDFDEKRLAFVSARVPGRIDRLYVDFTGKRVRKGEPLLDLYSPPLVTAQHEYLLALNTAERVKHSPRQEVVQAAEGLVEGPEQRLLLWGISEDQIAELRRERQPRIHMTIYSPIAGTVIEKKALEGKYVAEGEPLYMIVDLSYVWMLADIYEYEMGWVRLGRELQIRTPSFPDRVFRGTISFISPVLEEGTRTVNIRADVPNPEGLLKPGMFVNATIVVPTEEPVLAIPASAVLDAGVRKFVWVRLGGGRYERRLVEIGPEAGGYHPVVAGVSEGEQVVAAANFLIDSQAQLTAGAAAAGHAGH